MHFQDSEQVKKEIEEAKKEYMQSKKDSDAATAEKQVIDDKIDLFKIRFREQRKQTKRNQEQQIETEREIGTTVQQCNYLDKEN